MDLNFPVFLLQFSTNLIIWASFMIPKNNTSYGFTKGK